MRVLVGCERSGVVRRAFRERGHDAFSCDIVPADDGNQFHLQESVLVAMRRGWDLGIFFSPCTFILNSGCKHLYKHSRRFNRDKEGRIISENPRDPIRWHEMEKGAKFFRDCYNAPIPRIACENPIMVGYAKKIVGVEPSQIIQPWQFGHGETKATCLWLRGLPLLMPTEIVAGREQRIHKMGPSDTRGIQRSITFPGIAAAMAAQWG